MNKLQGFVMWLDGFLSATGGNLTIDQTKTIKEKLNNLFEHVAEEPKKQNPTLEELGKQHGFEVNMGFPGENIGFLGKDLTTGETYRC
jgi:hypothetical protein